MRISDWSSDVCSSDLHIIIGAEQDRFAPVADRDGGREHFFHHQAERVGDAGGEQVGALLDQRIEFGEEVGHGDTLISVRAEEGLSLEKTRLEAPWQALRDAISTSSMAHQGERESLN